jgi:hypothetical protein
MLRAKYYQDFKGIGQCMLISGNKQAYLDAGAFFKAFNGGPMTAGGIIIFEESGVIPNLAHDESQILADICKVLVYSNQPSHIYFTIKDFSEGEIIISCGEYIQLP